MTDGTTVMRDTCKQVTGYLPRLERLVSEPPPPAGVPVRPTPPAHTPLPGNPAAFYALTAAHAAARHVEDLLLYAVARRAGRGRGGSDKNTLAAYDAIPKLAAGAGDDAFRLAISDLDRVLNEIQSVPGIDENKRWRHLPRQAGQPLPPQCPFCEGFYLLADVESLLIVCSAPGCHDSNGDPPVATISIDEAHQPMLTWGDGKTERAPVLDTARLAHASRRQGSILRVPRGLEEILGRSQRVRGNLDLHQRPGQPESHLQLRDGTGAGTSRPGAVGSPGYPRTRRTR